MSYLVVNDSPCVQHWLELKQTHLICISTCIQASLDPLVHDQSTAYSSMNTRTTFLYALLTTQL